MVYWVLLQVIQGFLRPECIIQIGQTPNCQFYSSEHDRICNPSMKFWQRENNKKYVGYAQIKSPLIQMQPATRYVLKIQLTYCKQYTDLSEQWTVPLFDKTDKRGKSWYLWDISSSWMEHINNLEGEGQTRK